MDSMIDSVGMRTRFEIMGEPKGKGRPRVARRGGFASVYTPQETLDYENLIKVEYQRQCDKRYYGQAYIGMRITAYYGIPKSASKRKQREMVCGMIKPSKKPDIDNVVKVVCDALNGVAYKDDTQIMYLEIVKRYAEQPRVEVDIWEA